MKNDKSSKPDVSNLDVIRLKKEELSVLETIVKVRRRSGNSVFTLRDALSECIDPKGVYRRTSPDLDLIIMIEELNNRIQQLTFMNAELKKTMLIKNLGIVENLKSYAEEIRKSVS